ncbi:hypothetical protein KAI32_01840 [Candidatus Pacearchaeota archaeon]|nr:hypothetical protein [Candidatus Pacearchaeota archaeon]
MKNKLETLEDKSNKPNPNQWLPIWGVGQIIKDLKNGNPTIITKKTSDGIEGRNPFIYTGIVLYQSLSIVLATKGTLYSLHPLVEKLF